MDGQATQAVNQLKPVTESPTPLAGIAPEPQQLSNSTSDADRGAVVFVWGIWALLMLAGVAFAVTTCSYIPFSDDWIWVPVVTGQEHVTAAWLWEDIGEHRIPLSKLIVVGLYKLSGGDFRVGPIANMLSLGLLALAMIVVARKVRGRTSYTDAVFPLVLLTLNSERVLIAMGVSFIPSTILAGIVLLLIVRRGAPPGVVGSIVAGVCVVALALIGPHGLALVPALAVWLIYLGVFYWRSGGRGVRWGSVIIWCIAAVALLIVPLYFVGLRYLGDYLADPSTKPTLWVKSRTSLEFLTFSFGWAAGSTLAEGYTPPVVGMGVVLLSLISAIVLIVVCYKQPKERSRALGLLLFLGGMASLAWGMGSSRATRGLGAGYQGRYVILAVPVLLTLYFIWGLYGSRSAGRFIQMVFFTLLCIFFWPNVRKTLAFAEEYRRQMGAAEREILDGLPPRIIAARHSSFIYDEDAGADGAIHMAAYLTMLRHAGLRPFTSMSEDPVAIEVAFPVMPKELNQITWKDGIAEGHGDDPYMVFALEEPQFVDAVRIKYSYPKIQDPAVSFQMFWRRKDQDFAEERSVTFQIRAEQTEKTLLLPVNEVIDEFRIDPDNKPCVFKLSEIVLLVSPPDRHHPPQEWFPAAARDKVPPGAIVLIAGNVDDELTPGERKPWCFPQNEDGKYAGKPADSGEAVAQLEKLRAKGAQYLLFPKRSFWWLEYYKGLKEHLDGHYTRTYSDRDCIIYQLAAPKNK